MLVVHEALWEAASYRRPKTVKPYSVIELLLTQVRVDSDMHIPFAAKTVDCWVAMSLQSTFI